MMQTDFPMLISLATLLSPLPRVADPVTTGLAALVSHPVSRRTVSIAIWILFD